jgi:hypothetical protein
LCRGPRAAAGSAEEYHGLLVVADEERAYGLSRYVLEGQIYRALDTSGTEFSRRTDIE